MTAKPHPRLSASTRPNSARRGLSQIVDVSAGRIIFIAGQTALDRDGNVSAGTIFAAQASRCCEPCDALQASGCTPANLVKLTVFLTDRTISDAIARRAIASSARSPPAAPAVTLSRCRTLRLDFPDRDRGHRGGLSRCGNRGGVLKLQLPGPPQQSCPSLVSCSV